MEIMDLQVKYNLMNWFKIDLIVWKQDNKFLTKGIP